MSCSAFRFLQIRLKKYAILALLVASLSLVLCSCSSHPMVTPIGRLPAITVPLVTDNLGRMVPVPRRALRIISLSPTATEILYAVGAGNRLVADSTRCNYPPDALSLPHLDGVSPSHEKLIALHPDVIIVSDQTLTSERADQLAAQYGAPVYVLAAANYAGAEADIVRLGEAFGDADLAKRIAANMQAEADKVKRTVAARPKPRVFVVIWESPLMTAGGGSYFDDLIGLAGGVNVAHAEDKYPQYSIERLVADDPDVILTQTEGGAQSLAVLRPLRLRAMREGRVYAVPDDWTDRPGPRLALGLRAIAKFIHPEAFTK